MSARKPSPESSLPESTRSADITRPAVLDALEKAIEAGDEDTRDTILEIVHRARRRAEADYATLADEWIAWGDDDGSPFEQVARTRNAVDGLCAQWDEVIAIRRCLRTTIDDHARMVERTTDSLASVPTDHVGLVDLLKRGTHLVCERIAELRAIAAALDDVLVEGTPMPMETIRRRFLSMTVADIERGRVPIVTVHGGR